MALYAPVAPWHLIKKMKEEWGEPTLGNYFLVLAHDISAHPKEWAELLPEGSTVIIDNSVIELGQAVAHNILKEAHDILGPRVRRILVLPDTFDDPTKTFVDSYNCLEALKKKLDTFESTEFMYMIQVSNRQQIPYALDLWKKNRDFNTKVRWIGIPRRIADNLGSRMEPLLHTRLLKLQYADIKIHLFGFSNNVPDDVRCAVEKDIYGIDSTVPLRLGQQGVAIDFNYYGDQAGPRMLDGNKFWEDPSQPLNRMTYDNLLWTQIFVAGNSNTEG